MGSFKLNGYDLSSLSNGNLIGLRGNVCGRSLVFMVDSGATCNFINSAQFRTLGLNFDSCKEY